MGKFNVNHMRDLTKNDFRALAALEIGMKNHEIVPGPLAAQLANSSRGGVCRRLMNLCKYKLCSYERGKNYDGYRLTTLGYDYLALSALLSQKVISHVGSRFGCGKESDIYLVQDEEETCKCMKIHRLGRTCFRKLKEKRDYHQDRSISSWLYLSRISAKKEYDFLNILYEHKFPVPQPFGNNRHIVIMEEIIGDPLCHVKELDDPGKLFSDLIELIIKLANHGLIHCDFNEFNIMVTEEDKPILIDFPQMVSINHHDAEEYFDRDVNCLATFFKRRFNFDCDEVPSFKEDVKRTHYLDVLVKASGYKNADESSDENSSEDETILSDGEETETENATELCEESNVDDNSGSTSTNGCSSVCNLSLENDEGSSQTNDENDVLRETEFNQLSLDEDKESKKISKKKQKQLAEKAMHDMRMARLKEERERAKERQERIEEEFDDTASMVSYTSGLTNFTSVSCSTSVSRADILRAKDRVKVEAQIKLKQQIPKKSLRVKGEANAFRRKKLENQRVIKEHDGFLSFFN